MKRLTWTPAAVGCYWNAGDFHIGTSVLYLHGKPVLTFPQSAYVLMRNRVELGRYKTLRAAQRAAELVFDLSA
jgi:hypothetical protein